MNINKRPLTLACVLYLAYSAFLMARQKRYTTTMLIEEYLTISLNFSAILQPLMVM